MVKHVVLMIEPGQAHARQLTAVLSWDPLNFYVFKQINYTRVLLLFLRRGEEDLHLVLLRVYSWFRSGITPGETQDHMCS